MPHLRRAAHFIPEPVRSRLSAWRYGYAPGRLVRRGAPWTRDEDRLHLSVEGLHVALPRSWESRLEYQFCTNVASRAETLAFVRETVRVPGGVLFDVGAENGLFSVLHCAAAATNRAVLFEPAPPLIEQERAGLALNGFSDRAIVRHVAVSDSEGTSGGAIDQLGYAQLLPTGEGTYQVPVVRLDDEARRLGLTPTLIKIDVEGHELHVLRGATEMLRAKPVLFLELHSDLLRATGQDPREVVILLQRFGYRFYSHHGGEMPARRVAGTMHAILRLRAS